MHAGQSPMHLQCSVRHRARIARLRDIWIASHNTAWFHLFCSIYLFSQSSGFPASKKGMKATIVTAAHELGLATQSASGAELFGGHSLRVGGVQFLGRCGVEAARIHVLARHSSNATMRYLQDVYAQGMHNLAAEAGYNRSLDSLRLEFKLLQARVKAPSAHPEPAPCHKGTSAHSVWNPGLSSRLHFTKPDDSSRTLCDWQWTTCLKSVPDPPPDCAPVCAKCRTSFTEAPFSTLDADASISSTSSSFVLILLHVVAVPSTLRREQIGPSIPTSWSGCLPAN